MIVSANTELSSSKHTVFPSTLLIAETWVKFGGKILFFLKNEFDENQVTEIRKFSFL